MLIIRKDNGFENRGDGKQLLSKKDGQDRTVGPECNLTRAWESEDSINNTK